MGRKESWVRYPYSKESFDYFPDELEESWPRLHRGDREPFPDSAWIKRASAQQPLLRDELEENRLSPQTAAELLLEAWRCFHRGDFQQAVEQGLALGMLGYAPANKAENTQANYLESDTASKAALFQRVMQRAEQAQQRMPEHANSWYLYAYAAGRYAQCISVTKALAEGLAPKVRRSLERALELEPEHADAHTALGVFHAEIIDKVGSLIGGVTYGASRDEALKHYRRGVELAPESASALMEYADGLLILLGKRQRDEAVALYRKAAAIEPADALEKLDVELAKSQLE